MLKPRKQSRKLNNKGVTLVELIVAVTILMLVTGTLLSAFVVSMRMSKKSRDLHRATTVAQNIMEGIKLKTAEELAFQFNYPVLKDESNNDVYNFSVYRPTMFQYSAANLGSSVGELYALPEASGNITFGAVTTHMSKASYENTYADVDTRSEALKAGSVYLANLTTKDYEFIEDVDGRYYYYIRNLESDGAYYNAKITVDASAYRTGGGSAINANSEEMISVPTIDSTYDAVEVMGDHNAEVVQALQNAGISNIEDSKIKLRITVNIAHNALINASGVYRSKVTTKYEYFYNNGATPVLTISSETFDNEDNEAIQPLRNVYLYYRPSYGRKTDEIIIENGKNEDIDLYVIKQEIVDQSLLNAKEMAYHAKFTVNERGQDAEGKSHVSLHTNLNTNLSDVYTGNNTPLMQVESWIWNRAGVTQDIFHTTDIKNKQSWDRMFDVTVSIYESSRYASLSDFNGEDVADWFSDDKHLITITGSSSQ